MDIILYKNWSDPDVLNKRLDRLATESAQPYGEIDISAPQLVLSDIPVSVLNKVNYCFIPELERYYTAQVTLTNNGMYILYGAVDVLMSFKDEILTIPAIIDRQENPAECNTYVNNGGYVSRVDNFMQRYTWKHGFGGTPQNILITAGGGNYT